MTLLARNIGAPDELRRFGHGRIAVVSLDGVTVGRSVFEPGWRWSVDVRPIVGSESCLQAHTGYILAGRLCVRMDNGTEAVVGAGDAFVVSPGHEGWVVGEEPCVMLDWSGSAGYARR